MTELGAFMRTAFLCISVLRVATGPWVKLASCKSALNSPLVYSTDRSKAVVPLLLYGLFYEAICLYLTLSYFVLVFFSLF